MLYKKCCILCLEKSSSSDFSIDSNDQQSKKALETINQHFNEQLIMFSYISSKILCNPCWDLVQSFHEFFIKIQNTHLTAFSKLKSLQELEISVTELKVEPGYASDDLVFPPSVKSEEDKEKETTVSKNLAQVSYDVNVSSTESECSESDNNSEDIKAHGPMSIEVVNTKRTRQVRNPVNKKVEAKQKNKTHHKTLDCDKFIAKNFKLICVLCQTRVSDFKELKIHFRSMHQTNGYVKCCSKKFYNRGVLVDHIHVHNNPEYFKCHQCEKVACDRNSLLKHLQNLHDTNERTTYNCNICSKSFYRKKVLARHVLIHAPEEEKNVKCTECEKRFCNQYSMKQHLSLVHLNLYAKICDICGKALNGKDAFRRHQEEHAGVPIPQIKCPLCNRKHKTKYLLTRHMKTMHTEEYQTPQVCPICSKISPTLRAHKSHIEYMHAEKKKHVCKLCDKAFKLPRSLREHLTTHTGEVLYTCTFCPQTFNSHSNMYSHRKRKHPNEWAEKCEKPNTTTRTPKLIKKELISKITAMVSDGAK